MFYFIEEEHHRRRARSLDSNDAEDEDVRQVQPRKRKHKLEESPLKEGHREGKVKKRHRSDSNEGKFGSNLLNNPFP